MSRPIWYDSTEPGAPTLNNAAGSLLEVLRACLINGFNLKSVTSIVVASGVATATAATHGYTSKYGKLVRIAGAPEAGLNGDVQPLTVDTNTFTYACPGVADGTYTGTITARRAPLDWLETHTGTNKAIFKSQDLLATDHSLRVDDTSTASMSRWLGIPTALITGIDSYSGEFPSAAQVSGGAYVQRGALNDATPKAWVVVGDARGFFYAARVATASGVDRFAIYWFGDIEGFYAGDTGACLLTAQAGTTVTASPGFGLSTGHAVASEPNVNAAMYAPTGLSPAQTTPQYQQLLSPSGAANSSGFSQYPSALTFPNPVIHDLMYVMSTGPSIRGRLPGLAWLLNNQATVGFTGLEVVEVGDKRFLYLPTQNSGGACAHLIRLNGWRQ